MSIVHRAACFAIQAHAKQRRKYTDDAYIVHPMAVARMICDEGLSDEMIAAAWLHDTVEDCGVSIDTIRDEFDVAVASMVRDLTHVYTKEAFPNLNRAQRKKSERERMGGMSWEAKTIKLADLIDNTKSIVAQDPEFAVTYLAEARALLDGPLRTGDGRLWRRASEQIEVALAGLPS